MTASRITERPGGARDVVTCNLSLIRDLPRPGSPFPPKYRVELEVEFFTEDAAMEFDAKLRALLPEVKP